MREKRYNVVLFDMDGTVSNTDQMLFGALNVLYDKYRNGVRTPESKMIYFSGPPIRETLKTEFPHMDTQFMFDEFHKESLKLYETHTFPYEHSKEVLLKLKEDGFKLGIVTNKLHSTTEYALKCIGLDNIFEYIIGSNDVSKTKPDGEGILKAMAHFNGEKSKTIYIGDNAIDKLSADNAGVDCALVAWGPRVLPKEIKPKYRFNSYLELEDILYE